MNADVVERLGVPDIVLTGFRLWVHGYQSPDSEDAWDGNWLRVTAHCGASGASVWAAGAFLDTVAIRRFGGDLAALHAALAGVAELKTDEPELAVWVGADGHAGHVRVRVEITPDPAAQEHVFTFAADQSYLPPAVAQCRALLERYPVRDAARRDV